MVNTPQDDRFYKSETLLKWFGISSVVMLVFTIWMVLDDFGQEWKAYQAEFFSLQKKKYDQWIEEAKTKVDEAKIQGLKESIRKAEEGIQAKKGDVARLEKELVQLKTRRTNTTTRYQDAKAVYDVRKYEYEAKYGHKIAEGHQDDSPKAKAAREKLDKFWAEVLELRNIANEAAQAVEDKQKEIEALYAEKAAFEKELKPLVADLERLEMARKSSELTLSRLLRSAPVVDMANPTFRLQQIVLPEIRDDVYFAQVQKVDRCTTCHLAIDKPGFEKEPHPYRTHPRLDLMLGSRSPHPIDKIGCTVCHEGRGTATHFVRSAHTPRNEEHEKQWKKKYHWHEMHHVIEKMVPLQYTEGKCRVCHRQTEYVPGAEKLNTSVQLMRGAGCYGCHKIEGWEHLRKPAPSLKRIKGKVTRDWIVKWLHDPKKFNEHTRMPSSFFQSNVTSEEYKQFQVAEIHAISDYLLSESESYQPLPHGAAAGNIERGKELFGSIGCMGCHQINDFPRTRGRFDRGPDLSTVGSKVTKDWLLTWLKNPRHYWSETTMPSLRLTDSEALDIAEYLLSHRNSEFEQMAVASTDVETQKKALRLYLERDPKLAPVTKEKVDKTIESLKPHEVSFRLGQNAVSRYGCYGCHEIKGMETTPGIGPELTEVGSKPINKFDFGLLHISHTNHGWFHQKLANTRIFDHGFVKEYLDLLRMPNYGFTEEEKNSLVLGLMGMTSQKISPPAAKLMTVRDTQIEEGLRVVHKYNCQGCHVVEQLHHTLAEDDPNREEHEKRKYDLEGRILKYYEEDETLGPPPLVTEGARVHTDWVHAFMRNPGEMKLRGRLKLRMPSFQMPYDELNRLVTYWAAHGNVEFPIPEPKPVRLDAKQLADAKALFTKLACLNCHTAGEKLSVAEMEGGSRGLAPDLLLAAKRLRREWIVQLLKDPQKVIPGTRMPGFWPEGNSPAPEILGGNSEAQIQLLADYVIYLGQSRGQQAASPNKTAEAGSGKARSTQAKATLRAE